MPMYNIYIPQSKGEQVMAKKINLDMTSVENREMRLGTIIAWDGAASEFVKESDYEGRKAQSLPCLQPVLLLLKARLRNCLSCPMSSLSFPLQP